VLLRHQRGKNDVRITHAVLPLPEDMEKPPPYPAAVDDALHRAVFADNLEKLRKLLEAPNVSIDLFIACPSGECFAREIQFFLFASYFFGIFCFFKFSSYYLVFSLTVISGN
jgi:hypothetical protein